MKTLARNQFQYGGSKVWLQQSVTNWTDGWWD